LDRKWTSFIIWPRDRASISVQQLRIDNGTLFWSIHEYGTLFRSIRPNKSANNNNNNNNKVILRSCMHSVLGDKNSRNFYEGFSFWFVLLVVLAGIDVGCPLFEYLFEYFFWKIIHYSNIFWVNIRIIIFYLKTL
jgi:hypothetical protein